MAQTLTPPAPLTPSPIAPLLKLATILLLLVGIGVGTVEDYGVSWDEGAEIATVKYNAAWVGLGREIPPEFQYDGVGFDGMAEAVYQLTELARHGWEGNPWAVVDFDGDAIASKAEERAIAQAIYRRIQVKHLLTFLVTLLGYGAVAALVAMLAGLDYAWFGPVVLALMPRFWAHGFFNPQDMPFAALFAIATVAGAAWVAASQRLDAQPPTLSWHQMMMQAALYGVGVGVVCSTGMGGVVLLVLVPMTQGVVQGWGRMVTRFWPFYGVSGIMWAIATLLLHPASWSDPLPWLGSALLRVARPAWPGQVLFAGEFMPAAAVPWNYLPVWIWQTTPLLWQVSAGLGVIFLGVNFRRLTDRQRAAAVMVVLPLILVPAWAIAHQTPLYHGWRQFFFLVPGLAVLAATGLIWSYQQLVGQWQRFVALSAVTVAMSAIAVTMLTLHPHQYVYFNRISGGLPAAHGFYETDYWGVSLREAIAWVNAHAAPGATLALGGPDYIAQMFARPDLTLLDLKTDLDYGNRGVPPNYYIAMPYLKLPQIFPRCPVVYAVERDRVPLSLVKRCPRFIP
ncbi:hypothetical protein [Spirulina major]|uniref:hypothetical protein n=1 Tax=Spirulina major TaxID=270636 RepID=UPI00233036D1|nr:hypothetical protein [Spirulina major]